jgi:hypothetical protein
MFVERAISIYTITLVERVRVNYDIKLLSVEYVF